MYLSSQGREAVLFGQAQCPVHHAALLGVIDGLFGKQPLYPAGQIPGLGEINQIAQHLAVQSVLAVIKHHLVKPYMKMFKAVGILFKQFIQMHRFEIFAGGSQLLTLWNRFFRKGPCRAASA
ncbi:hypothetical protein GCM10011450_26970 [Advenella faeciporci]|uniref:Uncharacterized protein n=1 Tax=Advenella faeciporci TaxID=797535 RepID=A0A918JRF9_9BURK|nr:hypothetical protein GCM10011450_26970 [Advenella faeciporci]